MTSQPTVSSHTFLDCGDHEIVTVDWKRLPDGKRVNPAFGGSRSLVRFDRQSPGGHVSVEFPNFTGTDDRKFVREVDINAGLK